MNQSFDSAEARREVETLLSSGVFGPTSRTARLLQYLFDELCAGRAGNIKEYSIAVDLFGKSVDFDQHKDATVRVEAHRLRKRLLKYYETAGKDSTLRVGLPSGQYVLAFERVGAAEAAAASAASVAAHPLRRPRVPRRLMVRVAAACLLLVAVVAAGVWRLRPRSSDSVAAARRVDRPIADPEPEAVRILAGRLDAGLEDAGSRRWGPDRFFSGGAARRASRAIIDRTGRPALYEWVREGTSRYRIPLPPRDYELRLYFSDPDGPGAEVDPQRRFRIMTIEANGERILNAYDVAAETGFAADVRCFAPVRPGRDGVLELLFYSARGLAVVNAIELIPLANGKVRPIRITAQPQPFIDTDGRYWAPDDFYSGGRSSPYRSMVSGAPDPGVVAGERYGDFEYFVPVPPGAYKVTVAFAETWFGPEQYGGGGPGSRVFDVAVNRVPLIRDFDLLATTKPNTFVSRTFRHVRPDLRGKIHLEMISRTNFASLRAIEIVPEDDGVRAGRQP